MSAVLHEARENLRLTRETHGRRSSKTQAAFEQLVRAASATGTPLDALRHHIADEVERYFSYTIAGTDGHVYWDGGRDFRRNDGHARTPRRWWWVHVNGTIDPALDLVVTCGEPHCINPAHLKAERVRGVRVRWPEQRIIAVLQVAALRLGHSPTETEFEAMQIGPSTTWVRKRFDGSWHGALRAAGLPPSATAEFDRTAVLRGIQLVKRLFGRWPSENDYRRYATELQAAHLPSTKQAAIRLYGSFVAARLAAGGPAVMAGARMATEGSGSEGFTSGDCLRAIELVRARLGRWPSMRELAREADSLSAEGLPSSEKPFRRLFGSFTAARVAAGGLASVRSEEHLRPPHIGRTPSEDVLAGIVFVRDRIGRWPSRYEYVAEKAALEAAGLPVSEGPAQKVFGSFTAARVAAGGPAKIAGRSLRQSADPSGRESPSSQRSES